MSKCVVRSHNDVDITIIDIGWFGRLQIDHHTTLIDIGSRVHIHNHAALVYINWRVHIDDDATLVHIHRRVHVHIHCALVQIHHHVAVIHVDWVWTHSHHTFVHVGCRRSSD